MIRRPPRSTLFPYTSSSDLAGRPGRPGTFVSHWLDDWAKTELLRAKVRRSEEHTSELQSRPHLVCRLLLEKKKNFSKPLYHWQNSVGHYAHPACDYLLRLLC